MAQLVKDMVLSLQKLRSLLWCGLIAGWGMKKKKESAGGAEVWLDITHHARSLCLPPGPWTQLGIFSRFTVQPLLQLALFPHLPT